MSIEQLERKILVKPTRMYKKKSTEGSAKVLSLEVRFGVVHRGLSGAFRYLTTWKMNGLNLELK